MQLVLDTYFFIQNDEHRKDMLIIVSKRVPCAVFCYRAQDETVVGGGFDALPLWVGGCVAGWLQFPQ